MNISRNFHNVARRIPELIYSLEDEEKNEKDGLLSLSIIFLSSFIREGIQLG